jgi:hypothetical protein
MKTHMVIVEFARNYGIKEGLLLTELCRRAYLSGETTVPFSVSQGKAFFPYMSEKQIRLSLYNLKNSGSISTAPGSPTFDRTRRYAIQEAIYQFYLRIVMAAQLIVPQDFLPPVKGR